MFKIIHNWKQSIFNKMMIQLSQSNKKHLKTVTKLDMCGFPIWINKLLASHSNLWSLIGYFWQSGNLKQIRHKSFKSGSSGVLTVPLSSIILRTKYLLESVTDSTAIPGYCSTGHRANSSPENFETFNYSNNNYGIL